MSNGNTAWELEEAPAPLREQSLEEVFRLGETSKDKQSGYERVPVHGCPTVLKAAVYSLKPRVHGSQPAAFRLVTKLGAAYLKALPETKRVDKKKLGLSDPSVPLSTYSAMHHDWEYSFQHEALLTTGTRRFNANTFGWVHGLLGDLASVLGLSMSKVAALSIVAAISRSEEWVRQDLISACQEEVMRFRFALKSHYFPRPWPK